MNIRLINSRNSSAIARHSNLLKDYLNKHFKLNTTLIDIYNI